MTDAIRQDNEQETQAEPQTLVDFDLPVSSEFTAPMRVKKARSPAREAGDVFDRAFAALEEALRERDYALAKPMPQMETKAATPLVFPQTTVQAAPQIQQVKEIEPQIMRTPMQGGASGPSFVQPAYERVEIPHNVVPVIQPSSPFERVDAIIAQMQKAAADIAAKLPPVIEEASKESIHFVDTAAKSETPKVETGKAESAKPDDAHDLYPFGDATYRLMVM